MASSISLDAADDFLPPQDLQPHAPSSDTAIIAPWLGDAPAESELPETVRCVPSAVCARCVPARRAAARRLASKRWRGALRVPP